MGVETGPLKLTRGPEDDLGIVPPRPTFVPAKLMITLLLVIIGPGYLFGTANIVVKHQDADGEPGLTVDDLRATFHGMTRTFKPDDKRIVNSSMLKQVRPGGDMREHLDKGGEPAVRGLITWLENAATGGGVRQTGTGRTR